MAVVWPAAVKAPEVRKHRATDEETRQMPTAAQIAEIEDEAARASAIVEAFLIASMIPDPEAAAEYMAQGVDITFTGGRKFEHPREASEFNAGRYKWVKKQMDSFDVSPGDGRTVVYSMGSLYGEWPDGTQFSGNRYVDRFVVVDDKIVKMDVWNDSAERILGQREIIA